MTSSVYFELSRRWYRTTGNNNVGKELKPAADVICSYSSKNTPMRPERYHCFISLPVAARIEATSSEL